MRRACRRGAAGGSRGGEGGRDPGAGRGPARLRYIPGLVSSGQMKRAVRNVGYEARERDAGLDALDRERQARQEEIRRQGRNLLIAAAVGLLVMAGKVFDMPGGLESHFRPRG